MKIEIKYLSDKIEHLEKLEKGDWIDLRAAKNISLNQGETALIPLGICMKIPDGYEAHIAPRSSTYKNFGITMPNSIGIIDGSYCGEDDEWFMLAKAERDTSIAVNDRVCQFRIIEKQPEFELLIVEHMSGENRGGYGSTGKW